MPIPELFSNGHAPALARGAPDGAVMRDEMYPNRGSGNEHGVDGHCSAGETSEAVKLASATITAAASPRS